ncbi:MAG: 3-deoxy-D-manno-octulosonic acid kinase [Alteromonadaceae bacterium]|jgi:3-deoxy-D-manno-octulosonic acid kinase
MSLRIQQLENETLLSWELSPTDLSCFWFDPEYWQQQQKVYAKKKGRADTWFFQHDRTKGVLRHYWRGGMIGKLLQDQYLYLGLGRTRVYQEFTLLTHLHKKGLNVPFPIGAHVVKQGFVYRGDIITGAIPGAQSLLDILKIRRLSADELAKVADCIANFHQNGVYHADLNINNILISQYHTVYLIDFDRGMLKPPDPSWQRQNIDRLHRSFTKEAGRNIEFHWQDDDWKRLLACYKSKM